MIKNAYYLYLPALFGCLLPLAPHLATYSAGIMLLIWLFLLGKQVKNVYSNPLALLSVAFFVWQCVSLSYTEHFAPEGRQAIEVKIGLLLFPITLLGTADANAEKQRFWWASGGLLLGTLVASFVCFSNAVFNFCVTEVHTDIFFYQELTEILHFHPAYFSLYVVFLFYTLFYVLKHNIYGVDEWKYGRFLIYFINAWLLFFNLLLSARAGWIAMFAVGLVWFLYEMWQRKKLVQGVGLIAVTTAISLYILLQIPTTRLRIAPFLPFIKTERRVQPLHIDARWEAWKGAADLIQKNPILGVGVGDVVPDLQVTFAELNLTAAAYHKTLNAHNQWLQVQLGTGILGALLWCGLIFMPFWYYRTEKHYGLWLLFCSIFAIFVVTEAMLEVQRGTLFFGFFYFALVAATQKNSTKNNIVTQ